VLMHPRNLPLKLPLKGGCFGAQKNWGEGGFAGDGSGKKLGPIDGFVLGDGSEDARQGADAEGGVVRDTNALVAGLMGLKD